MKIDTRLLWDIPQGYLFLFLGFSILNLRKFDFGKNLYNDYRKLWYIIQVTSTHPITTLLLQKKNVDPIKKASGWKKRAPNAVRSCHMSPLIRVLASHETISSKGSPQKSCPCGFGRGDGPLRAPFLGRTF